MAIRRRDPGQPDYRALLNRRGDVLLGAYARQQRRRAILVAFSGVALIIVALWLYNSLQPSESVPVSGQYPAVVRCVRCGYEGRQMLDPKVVFPIKCPECGERACHKLWECKHCGVRFVPSGGLNELRCPNCGSGRVGTARESLPASPGADQGD